MSIDVSLVQDIGPLHTSRTLTAEEFEAYSLAHPELVMEQENDGTITITSPVSGKSGNRENQINAVLTIYEWKNPGKSFSASTGFKLPDGSTTSPDAAYVSQDKLSRLSDEEMVKYLKVVPDFVVEIRSATDSLPVLATKMRDTWIGNGVKLAWLADVDNDRLWIYRADHSVELISPLDRTITGEDVLPGFTFDLNLLS